MIHVYTERLAVADIIMHGVSFERLLITLRAAEHQLPDTYGICIKRAS